MMHIFTACSFESEQVMLKASWLYCSLCFDLPLKCWFSCLQVRPKMIMTLSASIMQVGMKKKGLASLDSLSTN